MNLFSFFSRKANESLFIRPESDYCHALSTCWLTDSLMFSRVDLCDIGWWWKMSRQFLLMLLLMLKMMLRHQENFGDSLMTARKQYFHNSRVRSELLGQSFEFNCLFVACYSCFGSQFDKTTRLLCFYSCITQKEWTKKQRAHAIYILHYVLNIRMDPLCLNEEEAKKGV